MSDSRAQLRKKLSVAADLHGVVRTMKAMAASSIGKFEQAARALAEYDRAVKLGLAVCLREMQWRPMPALSTAYKSPRLHAIVFGSDQGLVGQFNDLIADFTIEQLARLPGPAVVWAVGERVAAHLGDAGLAVKGLLQLPNDVSGIAGLVGHLQEQVETHEIYADNEPLYLFHNRQSTEAAYGPVCQRLLPFDRTWCERLIAIRWPDGSAPEMLAGPDITLRALMREYLFVSLFQACAESLASENASRLFAMQRADKNIGELKGELTQRFHHARQTSIDEELFDVTSGFEALNQAR